MNRKNFGLRDPIRLNKLVKRYGKNWNLLSQWFNGKTPKQLKHYWNSENMKRMNKFDILVTVVLREKKEYEKNNNERDRICEQINEEF